MEKLIELLASIIEEVKTNKTNYWYLFWIIFIFFIIFIIMLFLAYNKTNPLFEKIWEASFYIFSLFVFLFILSKWAKNYEDKKNLDMEKINKIKAIIENEKNNKIEIIKRRPAKDWWRLFDYKKDENNIIEFWYSLEKWELANIWIDCKNKELFKKINSKIESIENWKNYSDNFWITTIIPKDSQNLYKKNEDEIIKLIKNYMSIIEKTD